METESTNQAEPEITNKEKQPVKVETVNGFPNYIDFDTFHALGFDLYFDNGEYNLHLVFMVLDEHDNFDRGMFLRTATFENSIEGIANHIDTLFSMGLFANLHFMDTGHIIDSKGDIIGEVDWAAHDLVSMNMYNPNGVIH